MADTVWLQRPSGEVPWGFRLAGGADQQQALTVQRVTAGSIAATGLNKGDVICGIGERDTTGLTNAQANELIKQSGNLLQIHIAGSNRSPGAPPPMQQQQVAPPSAGVHDLFSNMYGQEQPAQYQYGPSSSYAPPQAPVQAPQPSYSPVQPSQPAYASQAPSYPSSPSQKGQYPSTNPPSYQASHSPQYSSNGYDDNQAFQPVYGLKNQMYNAQAFGEANTAPGQPPIESPEPEPAVAYSRQSSKVYSPLQTAEIWGQESKSEPTVIPVRREVSAANSPGQQAYSPGQNSFMGQPYSPGQSRANQSFSPGQSNRPFSPGQTNQSFSPGQSNRPFSPGQSNQSFSPGQSQSFSSGRSNQGYSPVAYQPKPTFDATQYSSSPADKSDAYVHGTYAVQNPDHVAQDNNFTARSLSYEDGSMPPPPPPEMAETEPAPDTPGLAPPPPPTFNVVPDSPSAPAPPPPPPPPPPPLSSPNSSWKDKQANQNGAAPQPTRLAQQLSNMSVGDGSYPFANEPPPPAPGGPGYGQPSFGTSHGAPTYVGGANQSPQSPSKPQQQQSPDQGHAMPDAVLNMAAKGPPEKKPWTYAPDTESIKSQRDKVRKKQPSTNLPRYQHMLNMPDFNDPPKLIAPPSGPHAPVGVQQQAPEDQVNQDGVYVHSQYNSPLQMYSNDAVDEAFSGQTQGKVSGTKAAGTPGTPNKDIVMSPTYRLIHGLDAEKPRQKVMLPPEARHNVRQPSKDDELKFSGLVSHSDIPSRSFHRLQQQISDEAPPQQGGGASDNNSLGVDDIGNYDQTSIRYKGRNIPSKSFRMLQNMTGGPMDDLPEPAPRAQRRRPPVEQAPVSPQQDPDDIVDIRFVGGNIPSRSFRMLQQSIGDPVQPQGAASSFGPQPAVSNAQQPQQRTVKIIKLRTQAPTPPPQSDLTTDF